MIYIYILHTKQIVAKLLLFLKQISYVIYSFGGTTELYDKRELSLFCGR